MIQLVLFEAFSIVQLFASCEELVYLIKGLIKK